MKQMGRDVWAWALYDWANSAFATTVMAGFFPIFLKQYWNAGTGPTQSTFQLGMGNAIAGLLIALMAPALGAIADRGGTKKTFLLSFTAMGVVMSGGLFFVPQGSWPLAVLMFVVGVIGFSGSNIFYNALIIDVAPERQSDFVSAMGFALGYLGGGILFAINVVMTLRPAWFGLPHASAAVRWSFVSVAVWWAVFSMPLFRYVRERGHRQQRAAGASVVKEGLQQMVQTLRKAGTLQTVFLFLGAYWFYMDGVNTVGVMAIDYGLSIGLPTSSLITALLLVQFIGFPAAIGFGYLADRIGTKAGIYIGLAVYTTVTIWAYFLDNATEFFIMAVAIGLVQGGVQALSRSFYARIIPADKAAEFFGFYGMVGKFATIIGPALMGWVAWRTGSSRLAIAVIAILFILGGLLLSRVDESRAKAEARQLYEG